MTILFILLLLMVAMPSKSEETRGDVQKPGIEKNVCHRLTQLNLRNSIKVFSVSDKGDYVYALPILTEGRDLLWDDLHTNRKFWIKNPKLLTSLFHGKGAESWRSPKKSSLHVIVYRFPNKLRYYKMHVDNWAPKYLDWVNSAKHIFAEVMWNAVTGRSVDQNRIERGLRKIDEKFKGMP